MSEMNMAEMTETEIAVRWIRVRLQGDVKDLTKAAAQFIEGATKYGSRGIGSYGDDFVKAEHRAKLAAKILEADSVEALREALAKAVERETYDQIHFHGERSSCDYSRAIGTSQAEARGGTITDLTAMLHSLNRAIYEDTREGMCERLGALAEAARQAAAYASSEPKLSQKARAAAMEAVRAFGNIAYFAGMSPQDLSQNATSVRASWYAVTGTDTTVLYQAKFPTAGREHQATLEKVGPEMGPLLKRLGVIEAA